LEVLYTLREVCGIPFGKLIDMSYQKNIAKGGFSKGYFLVSVHDGKMDGKSAKITILDELHKKNDNVLKYGDLSCVVCGEYAGEGRRICVNCERGAK